MVANSSSPTVTVVANPSSSTVLPSAPSPPTQDDEFSFSSYATPQITAPVPQLWQSTSMSTSAIDTSTSTSASVEALMTKHLAGSSLHSWPPPFLPHDLRYTSTQVGEALRTLDHEIKETIRLEAGKSFQSYITAYKDGMDKSTSTVLQHWEDLIKKWEDRLKTVDSLISNKLETIVREEAYRALSDEKRAFYNHLKATFNTLDAGKQELHQVVADSLTSYVSELQDTLERSTQALVLNQKHLEAVVRELQRLQQCRGNSNSGSNDNLAEERIDNTTNNITHSSHTPPWC